MTVSEGDVKRLVKDAITRHRPNGFGLIVEEDSIRKDGDWWYVAVVPDRNDVRAYDYATRLSVIEEDVEETSGVKILLVPVIVGD